MAGNGLIELAPDEAEAFARRFDLAALEPAFLDDPFPRYHALRRFAPVKRLPDGSVFLSRYADVAVCYRDPTMRSDKKAEFGPKFGAGTPLYKHHTTSLVFNDPPLHTRVRKIIAGALTPRAIMAMEPAIAALVDGLLDRMQDAGRADLIEDFASLIPVEVIGNLLDVPHAERGPLRRWSLAILGALEPAPSGEVLTAGNAAVEDFTAYLAGLVAARRARPGDPQTDVLTRLIAGEADEGQLSEAELLHNCVFILNAGHETTTNLIGNGLQLLIQWPGERARLIAEPGLIGTAVEEFLRFESSNQLGNRSVGVETEIGGVTMAPGSLLTLGIGAANRDPEQFADPERLDIGRTPNRHLAFGGGPHLCAGISLARLEGRVAIGRFLARFPDYRPAGEAMRGGRARFRGFVALPVEVG